MLYLGIDQHARQITISLRDENADVLQARQVSTQPEKMNAFFQRLTRERLRVNRERLLQGKPVRGLRQIDIASTTDQENRRLTTLRKDAGGARTRVINKIKQILRRHNLHWEMPTKTFPTVSAIAW